jgi:hypothetical protein
MQPERSLPLRSKLGEEKAGQGGGGSTSLILPLCFSDLLINQRSTTTTLSVPVIAVFSPNSPSSEFPELK